MKEESQPKKFAVGRCLALVMGIAALLVGCGGGSSSPDLTPSAVTDCLHANGARYEGLAPQQPKGFPANTQHVFAKGPVTGHIVVFMSSRPVFTRRLASAYREINEYKAFVARGGRALILLDPEPVPLDKKIVFRCVEG